MENFLLLNVTNIQATYGVGTFTETDIPTTMAEANLTTTTLSQHQTQLEFDKNLRYIFWGIFIVFTYLSYFFLFWIFWQWHYGYLVYLSILLFSSMASKPITIRWIRTGSKTDWKIMYSIELQTIFYEYQNKNHKINTSVLSPGLRPLGAKITGFHWIPIVKN